MAGKLIVLEGTDGSGKSTQFLRLSRRLRAEGQDFHQLVFPRYQEESSALIRLYLSGAFGSRPGDVNAYAASSFYAVDRYASYRQDWGAYYEQDERPDFFRWLYEYEYQQLGLPRPDLVCYLDMPTGLSLSLLRGREAATNTKADIHEQDSDYLAQCRRCAQEAAEVLGWQKIPCTRDGALRTIEEIHEDIWTAVQTVLND